MDIIGAGLLPPMLVVAGMLMGFASSLHCAGMCGCIASAVMFTAHPDGSARQRTRTLLLTQAGRILAYCAAGGVLGLFGSGFAAAFDQAAAFRMIHLASAATLIWVGLSTAGLLPAPMVFSRLAGPIGTTIMTLSGRHAGFGTAAAVGTGVLWGFLPCAMVYGALLTAMLTGTGAGGMSLMLGFGLGTLPAVIGTALGLVSIRGLAQNPSTMVVIGLLIAGFGVASVFLTGSNSMLCLPRF
ncbi:sulfite exporter TauE/SafE family protein [Phreatobacter aquaticus]|uniref:Sulfite exporter TauE/SafE family protein n=1 Tax=Phreatobacter aquaticus TaxID=2570229 RepID=A0A4D7QPN3_9HYPH|nr:sulfite exporter TauE/SafE family protein [Phreatobacter aquaticus]QCK88401.1 sulfite exporter TauE/SafE family protein [Phreatobacter aquaticus]